MSVEDRKVSHTPAHKVKAQNSKQPENHLLFGTFPSLEQSRSQSSQGSTAHVFEPMFQLMAPRFLDFRSYCASQVDHSIPEVLVGRSTAGQG